MTTESVEVAMITSRLSSPRGRAVAVALFAAAIGIVPGTPVSTSEQESKSVAAVKALAEALDAAKLDSIAAADPSEPGTFAAALYFPGAQILVVPAKYAAPSLLVDKIKSKNYRDVYIDLNSASVAGTKIFVIDQGADGLMLKPGDNQAFDSYENGRTSLAFDGDWKKAKMSEEQYQKAFAAADERYTKILALLAAHTKGSSS